MDDALVARLQAEHCPPLDPALLSAILSDYHLGNDRDVEEARTVLQLLKENAAVEEAAGFDHSGASAEDQDSGVMRSAESSRSDQGLLLETDVSSMSKGFSSMDLEANHVDQADSNLVDNAASLDRLDGSTKTQLLQEIFGTQVSRYHIEHTLKKSNGNWTTTMEELLNHVYIFRAHPDHDGGKINAKGIEAFSEDNMLPRVRKGKQRNQRPQTSSDRTSPRTPASSGCCPRTPPNRWVAAAKDIEFIASRTGVLKSTVSSTYYEHAASPQQTIRALLQRAASEESQRVTTGEEGVAKQARELCREFPNITSATLQMIVRLAPSSVAARELCTILAAESSGTGASIVITPQFVRPTTFDLETEASTVSQPIRPGASSGPSAAARRDAYSLVRAAAVVQAANAHRRSRSDRLMGGAAAYYSQLGREYGALSRSASASAADEVAAAQATRDEVDLHGIDVQNGVRIARERVEAWWEGLGERRTAGRMGAEERRSGYRVVVGQGNHSEGGRGKLGPAVGKALREAGWRVEHAGAVLVVKGPKPG